MYGIDELYTKKEVGVILEIVGMLLVMIAVGAFIGGLTNSLAIKMLFRPYEKKYIGKWRVPFTPGVIPKRRDQLAIQLGQLVVEHLVTAESVQAKLQEEKVKNDVEHVCRKMYQQFTTQQLTMKDVLHKLDVSITEEQVEERIGKVIEQKYRNLMDANGSKQLQDVISEDFAQKLDQNIDTITTYIYNKIIAVVEEPTTKRKIEELVETYIQSKGFLGNMLLSMVSSEDIANKVHYYVKEYIQTEEGYNKIETLVQSEWTQLKQKKVEDLYRIILDDTVILKLKKQILAQLNISELMNKPIETWLKPLERKVYEQWIPQLVEQVLSKLMTYVPTMLDKLEVAKMVEKQVASFPTSRIETIILSISKKEFKLITYLGALLGGVIGLIQGLFIVFIG